MAGEPILDGAEQVDVQWRIWLSEGQAAGDWGFAEHNCWARMLIYQHQDDPTQPGHAVCQGCGSVWRLELEHRS
jgi:hypothetical protein